MHHVLAVCLIWLLALPVYAFSPGQQVVALNPQVAPLAYSQGAAPINDDLTAGGYPASGGICSEWGHQVPCGLHYSTARAQTVNSYAAALDGTLVPFAANQLRLGSGNGSLIEEGRTNDALWARDLTQSGTWVAVGTGTAKNAVGADGVANAATTLTANGTAGSCTASCTILQTITLGSTADTYSVRLKRVTGTGTVNITINNLAGVTACTLNTTSFTTCSVTATLANPVVGIQMTAVSDVIIADFNQMEPGSFVTSPIPTTTVAVARNADNITGSGTLSSISSIGTIVASVNIEGVSAATRNQILGLGADVANNNRWMFRASLNSATTLPTFTVGNGASLTNLQDTTYSLNTATKLAGSWSSTTSVFAMSSRATISGGNGWNAQAGAPTVGSIGSASYLDGYLGKLGILSTFNSSPTAMTQ